MASPDFGKSVDPFSTRAGGQINFLAPGFSDSPTALAYAVHAALHCPTLHILGIAKAVKLFKVSAWLKG